MPNNPVSPPLQLSRKQSSEEVNRALARFPLILSILGELGDTRLPFPGDDDLRHGCERALTSMLSELARIPPAPAGKPAKAEETAQSWLQDPASRQWIDADKLERMQQFIDAILNPSSQGSAVADHPSP